MQLDSIQALVTGGATGIGLATARALQQAGAQVAICGRREGPLAEARAEYGFHAFQADVSKEDEVDALAARVVRALPNWNVLINNAGFGRFAPLLELEARDLREVFETNVFGATLVARAAARHFVAQSTGSIVNVASTAARKGYANGSAYAASKFALSGLTECWRAELRQHQIRVMQVNPSEVQTAFGGAERDGSNPTKLVADDVAQLIVGLLALPDRGFVTEASLWATNPRS